MRKKYITRKSSENTTWYTFIQPNAKGETVVVEITKCTNSGGARSLPYLWKKKGYIDRELDTYLCVDTYVKDTEGRSWGMYNPQHKRSEDNKRTEINFDWMFEATEENEQRLLDEVYRLASAARGKTATEEKHDNVKEFARKNNIEIFKNIPEGWQEMRRAMTAPRGSIWVCNMESIISGKRKKGLLIV